MNYILNFLKYLKKNDDIDIDKIVKQWLLV